MRKQKLAQQLRERQYKVASVDRTVIEDASDDEIIDAYITCSQCDKKQVNDEQLHQAIFWATDADDFLDICDEIGDHLSHF